MTNVIPFEPKDGVFGISNEFTFEAEDFIESRLPFSFNIIQHEAEGMVFLEACVPAAMATEFLRLLMQYREAQTSAPMTAATASSGRSRHGAANRARPARSRWNTSSASPRATWRR